MSPISRPLSMHLPISALIIIALSLLSAINAPEPSNNVSDEMEWWEGPLEQKLSDLEKYTQELANLVDNLERSTTQAEKLDHIKAFLTKYPGDANLLDAAARAAMRPRE